MLVFVGVKMLLTDVYTIPVYISLAVILVTLALAVAASLLRPPHRPRPARPSTAAATDGTVPASGDETHDRQPRG